MKAILSINKKIYRKLGKFIYLLSVVPQRIYGTHKQRSRVRALILVDGNVLLVRNWLGMQRWTLPGGGAKRSETDQDALSREVHEELGININSESWAFLGHFLQNDTPTPFTVNCFFITGAPDLKLQKPSHNHELIDASWFPVDALPKDSSLELKKARLLLQKRVKGQ